MQNGGLTLENSLIQCELASDKNQSNASVIFFITHSQGTVLDPALNNVSINSSCVIDCVSPFVYTDFNPVIGNFSQCPSETIIRSETLTRNDNFTSINTNANTFMTTDTSMQTLGSGINIANPSYQLIQIIATSNYPLIFDYPIELQSPTITLSSVPFTGSPLIVAPAITISGILSLDLSEVGVGDLDGLQVQLFSVAPSGTFQSMQLIGVDVCLNIHLKRLIH